VLLAAVAGGPLAAQDPEPLRKSELVRLLAGSTVQKPEIAALVRRHCLSFTPTVRDRLDLVALGADEAILMSVDECARRAARPAAAPPPAARPPVVLPPRPTAPVRRPTPPPPVPARPAPAPPRLAPTRRVVSPARTGFVSGGGQRGRVGVALPLPVVFEVRDPTNAAVVGEEVAFTVSNGRIDRALAATDSLGQVRLAVVPGPRAELTMIRARLGAIERQVSVVGLAGTPVLLVVSCGAVAAPNRVTLRAGAAARLEVAVRDAFGNDLPVTALGAAVGDARLVRVTGVAAQGSRGVVTLDARRPGSTNLAVFASGVRANVTARISAAGLAGCGP